MLYVQRKLRKADLQEETAQFITAPGQDGSTAGD